jgi:hypothetical protein
MKLLPLVITSLLLTPITLLSAVSNDEGLSKEAAAQMVTDKFAAPPVNEKKSDLPDKLPASIQAQMAEQKASGKNLEIKVGTLALGGEINMKFTVLLRETEATDKKRPLFIAMHGGGAFPDEPGPHTGKVNTSEFNAQIKLTIGAYKPDGVYFIPRMADDRLGRWWHKHNQVAFDRVIDHAIRHWNVDPNRVYILGISEGGYGTDILAPFMADRLAGANAMAAGVGLGNPPINLRNVAFRTDVGELDTHIGRRPMAEKFHAELDRFHQLDPDGYSHSINVQPGKGHGVDYRPGIQWIANYTRNPWPTKIIWVNQTMDGVRRTRFYWVAMPSAPEKGDVLIEAVANKANNTVTIDVATLDLTNTDGNRTHGMDNVSEGKRTPMNNTKVDILLNDALLDLSKPVIVIANGKQVFSGFVPRRGEVITAALIDRSDPADCPTAKITVTTP